MTKKQIKLLSLAYKHPVTIQKICNTLNLDYDSFTDLLCGLDGYWNFKENSIYEKSLFSLSLSGISCVEAHRREFQKDLRGWITTIVAFLALILSLISLLWQTYTWKVERRELTQSRAEAAATTEADGLRSSRTYNLEFD